MTKPLSRTTTGRNTAMAASTTSSKLIPKASPKAEHRLPLRQKSNVATVPDSSWADSYIKRVIDADEAVNDFILFDYALMKHHNVLLEGHTATGKTSAVVGWAAAREFRFYSISSSIGLEPSQLFGKYIPDEDNSGHIIWQDGPVTDVVRNGGVLLINEINFIPERVGTVLFSLLDKRREIQLLDHKGEVIKAHDDLIVFADMNPDYEGTRSLNKALRNRFSIQLTWEYDPVLEEKLVGIPALARLAQQLRSKLASGDFTTPVGTNMLIEFVDNYRHLGLNIATLLFANHFSADERHTLQTILNAHERELAADLGKAVKRLTPYGENIYSRKNGGNYPLDWAYEDWEYPYADDVDEQDTDSGNNDVTIGDDINA